MSNTGIDRGARRWRAATAAAVLAFAPVTLTACGGSSSAESSDTTVAAEGAAGERSDRGPGMGVDPEALEAWTTCLGDNGVEIDIDAMGEPPEMPDDGERPAPPDGEMPGEPPADGEAPGGTPPEGAPEGGPMGGGMMFGLDSNDPEVAAAIDACSDLQPEMGPPGEGGPGQMPPGGDAPDGPASGDATEGAAAA